MEDVVQPFLSYTKETHLPSQDMYDTLLPFCNGWQSNVELMDAYVEARNYLMQTLDLQFDDVNVDDVVDYER